VRGVVDSSDLSLNVSREILQQDRQIAQIRRALATKVVKALADMLKDEREQYEKFWRNFGPTLKEGIVREPEKKETLLPVMLFNTTHSDTLSTLAEYVERMKPGQPAIYYITGQSLDVLKGSPLLERLKQKEYEVILMDHPVDDFVVSKVDTFQEHPLTSIAATDLELDNEEEKKDREEKLKEKREQLGSLIDVVKETLSEHVKDVQLSSRLTDSAVCLVSDEGNTQFMEQMYRQMGQEPPKTKRVMELNPNHPLFTRMQGLSRESQKDWSELLYFQALISEGTKVEDPASFVRKMTKVMVESSGA
jgi:molecular chaperone HtpG